MQISAGKKTRSETHSPRLGGEKAFSPKKEFLRLRSDFKADLKAVIDAPADASFGAFVLFLENFSF